MAEVQGGRGAESDEVVGLDHSSDAGANRDPAGIFRAVHRASHLKSVIAHGLILSEPEVELTVNG